jgi:uncharacterized protein YbcI
MVERANRKGGEALAELSNAMAALHREHFGRGPGAARSFLTDGLAVCVLSDIYTPVERTLISTGQFDHVRETRTLHQLALQEEYKSQARSITGYPVEAFLSMVHIDPDLAVAMFLLGDE